MNTDEKGMDTDGRICFAKHSKHPCSSLGYPVFIIFKSFGVDDESLDRVSPLAIATFAGLDLQDRKTGYALASAAAQGSNPASL